MSYGVSADLQIAIFTALETDPALSALVAGSIFDTMPTGPKPPFFVALGPETVTERSDGSGQGAIHDLQITIVTEASGFLKAKQAGARVSDILTAPGLSLGRGQLISMRFLKAKARRVTNDDARRIDLWFRARVTDDQ